MHSCVKSYELAFKDKPRLDYLRVSGSVLYAHFDNAMRTKLHSKIFKCIFMDYAENLKGYRVYNLKSNMVKVIRSMKLDEREVYGIYDSAPTEITTVIFSTKDVNEVVLHEPERKASADVPMGSVEENHEEDTNMPEPSRMTRRGMRWQDTEEHQGQPSVIT